MFLSSMFLLCIICEVQQYLAFNDGLLPVRILRIWEHLSVQEEIRDVYEMGYKELYDLPSVGQTP